MDDIQRKRLEFARSRFQEIVPGIGKNCSIHESVVIGEGTRIDDNVVIKENVTIGKYCHIFPGAVIGAAGFGFARDEDETPIRIHHNGGVIIGDYVEIGTLTCVIAGTVDPTIVNDYVKTDAHVHIAHNCSIGKKTLMAAGVLIGGSTVIGARCFLGIGCSIKNKIIIADDTFIGQQANVLKNTRVHTIMIGNPAREMK